MRSVCVQGRVRAFWNRPVLAREILGKACAGDSLLVVYARRRLVGVGW
jgi:hypothetical protein